MGTDQDMLRRKNSEDEFVRVSVFASWVEKTTGQEFGVRMWRKWGLRAGVLVFLVSLMGYGGLPCRLQSNPSAKQKRRAVPSGATRRCKAGVFEVSLQLSGTFSGLLQVRPASVLLAIGPIHCAWPRHHAVNIVFPSGSRTVSQCPW